MTEYVDASPAKRFFIEMLVRDIRLEDAIVDLVDNAVDSLIRYQKIQLPNLLPSVTGSQKHADLSETKRKVDIRIEPDQFLIEDNCGGMDYEHARTHVFRFGADEKPQEAYLSVYGIGLKRAVLKLGRLITVESRTMDSGFKVVIDVAEFEKSPEWHFPIKRLPPAKSEENCGTTVTIRKLTDETSNRLSGGSFENQLNSALSQSYSLFLEHCLTVTLNGLTVTPATIPISNSEAVETSLTKQKFGNVEVFIVAGLQSPDGNDWHGSTSGWYVVCNGRVVVYADRTELSGWGVQLPTFQPKHRGFIGIALFVSDDPELLPWTTTKQGINSESAVYQFVREIMISDARPVIRFLDQRYAKVPVSSENTDDLEVRDRPLLEALKPIQVNAILDEVPRRFKAKTEVSRKTKTLSVQYRTERIKIEKARRSIGDEEMAAGKVGLYTLEYFLANEAN